MAFVVTQDLAEILTLRCADAETVRPPGEEGPLDRFRWHRVDSAITRVDLLITCVGFRITRFARFAR